MAGEGGFKPEEATDKLTCPYVREVKRGGGRERQGAFQGSEGKGVELNLVNVGVLGSQRDREAKGWYGRRVKQAGGPSLPCLVI